MWPRHNLVLPSDAVDHVSLAAHRAYPAGGFPVVPGHLRHVDIAGAAWSVASVRHADFQPGTGLPGWPVRRHPAGRACRRWRADDGGAEPRAGYAPGRGRPDACGGGRRWPHAGARGALSRSRTGAAGPAARDPWQPGQPALGRRLDLAAAGQRAPRTGDRGRQPGRERFPVAAARARARAGLVGLAIGVLGAALCYGMARRLQRPSSR